MYLNINTYPFFQLTKDTIDIRDKTVVYFHLILLKNKLNSFPFKFWYKKVTLPDHRNFYLSSSGRISG